MWAGNTHCHGFSLAACLVTRRRTDRGMGAPGSLRLDGCWREGGSDCCWSLWAAREKRRWLHKCRFSVDRNQWYSLSRAARNPAGLGAASPIGFSCKKPNIHPPTLFRESLMNQIHQRDYESGALSSLVKWFANFTTHPQGWRWREAGPSPQRRI